jgi:hypothetical protein
MTHEEMIRENESHKRKMLFIRALGIGAILFGLCLLL